MSRTASLVLILSLSACGSNSSYSDTEDDYGESSYIAAEEVPPAALAEGQAEPSGDMLDEPLTGSFGSFTGGGSAPYGGYGSLDSEEEEEREPFDEFAARARAEQEVADEGYDYRYGCTVDCSGHEAGFGYAAEGYIDGGTSRSPSFDEGQWAYDEAVEERVEDLRQAYEDGEDQY